jgi:hypothetical protein
MDNLKYFEAGITNNYIYEEIKIVACVFITAVMFIPSRCLETKGRIRYTEPLLSNHCRDTRTDTD